MNVAPPFSKLVVTKQATKSVRPGLARTPQSPGTRHISEAQQLYVNRRATSFLMSWRLVSALDKATTVVIAT